MRKIVKLAVIAGLIGTSAMAGGKVTPCINNMLYAIKYTKQVEKAINEQNKNQFMSSLDKLKKVKPNFSKTCKKEMSKAEYTQQMTNFNNVIKNYNFILKKIERL